MACFVSTSPGLFDQPYKSAQTLAHDLLSALNEEKVHHSFTNALFDAFSLTHKRDELIAQLAHSSGAVRSQVQEYLKAHGYADVDLNTLLQEKKNETLATINAVKHTAATAVGSFVNLALGSALMITPLGLLGPLIGAGGGLVAEAFVQGGLSYLTGDKFDWNQLGENLEEIASEQFNLALNTYSGLATGGVLGRFIMQGGRIFSFVHGAASMVSLESAKAFWRGGLTSDELYKLIFDSTLASVDSLLGLKGLTHIASNITFQGFLGAWHAFEASGDLTPAQLIEAFGAQIGMAGHQMYNHTMHIAGQQAAHAATLAAHSAEKIGGHAIDAAQTALHYGQEKVARAQKWAQENPQITNTAIGLTIAGLGHLMDNPPLTIGGATMVLASQPSKQPVTLKEIIKSDSDAFSKKEWNQFLRGKGKFQNTWSTLFDHLRTKGLDTQHGVLLVARTTSNEGISDVLFKPGTTPPPTHNNAIWIKLNNEGKVEGISKHHQGNITKDLWDGPLVFSKELQEKSVPLLLEHALMEGVTQQTSGFVGLSEERAITIVGRKTLHQKWKQIRQKVPDIQECVLHLTWYSRSISGQSTLQLSLLPPDQLPNGAQYRNIPLLFNESGIHVQSIGTTVEPFIIEALLKNTDYDISNEVLKSGATRLLISKMEEVRRAYQTDPNFMSQARTGISDYWQEIISARSQIGELRCKIHYTGTNNLRLLPTTPELSGPQIIFSKTGIIIEAAHLLPTDGLLSCYADPLITLSPTDLAEAERSFVEEIYLNNFPRNNKEGRTATTWQQFLTALGSTNSPPILQSFIKIRSRQIANLTLCVHDRNYLTEKICFSIVNDCTTGPYNTDNYSYVQLRFKPSGELLIAGVIAGKNKKAALLEAIAHSPCKTRGERRTEQKSSTPNPQLVAAKKELASTETELTSAEAQLTSTQQAVAESDAKVRVNETDLANKRNQLTTAEARLADGHAELATKQSELDEREAQIARKEEAQQATTANIEELSTRQRELEAKQAESTAEITQLEAQKAQLLATQQSVQQTTIVSLNTLIKATQTEIAAKLNTAPEQPQYLEIRKAENLVGISLHVLTKKPRLDLPFIEIRRHPVTHEVIATEANNISSASIAQLAEWNLFADTRYDFSWRLGPNGMICKDLGHLDNSRAIRTLVTAKAKQLLKESKDSTTIHLVVTSQTNNVTGLHLQTTPPVLNINQISIELRVNPREALCAIAICKAINTKTHPSLVDYMVSADWFRNQLHDSSWKLEGLNPIEAATTHKADIQNLLNTYGKEYSGRFAITIETDSTTGHIVEVTSNRGDFTKAQENQTTLVCYRDSAGNTHLINTEGNAEIPQAFINNQLVVDSRKNWLICSLGQTATELSYTSVSARANLIDTLSSDPRYLHFRLLSDGKSTYQLAHLSLEATAPTSGMSGIRLTLVSGRISADSPAGPRGKDGLNFFQTANWVDLVSLPTTAQTANQPKTSNSPLQAHPSFSGRLTSDNLAMSTNTLQSAIRKIPADCVIVASPEGITKKTTRAVGQTETTWIFPNGLSVNSMKKFVWAFDPNNSNPPVNLSGYSEWWGQNQHRLPPHVVLTVRDDQIVCVRETKDGGLAEILREVGVLPQNKQPESETRQVESGVPTATRNPQGRIKKRK